MGINLPTDPKMLKKESKNYYLILKNSKQRLFRIFTYNRPWWFWFCLES